FRSNRVLPDERYPDGPPEGGPRTRRVRLQPDQVHRFPYPVKTSSLVFALVCSATASVPAGKRSCPDASFAARYTASATSDSVVTVVTCANEARMGFAKAAYASGNKPSMRDPPLLVKRVVGPKPGSTSLTCTL